MSMKDDYAIDLAIKAMNETSDKISKSILSALKDVPMFTSAVPKKGLTKDDLDKLVESLQPKQIICTSSQEVYNELMKLPNINEKCLRFSKIIGGTIIVDMRKLGDYSVMVTERMIDQND